MCTLAIFHTSSNPKVLVIGAPSHFDPWDDATNDSLVGDMLAPPTLFKLAVKAHDTVPKIDAALAKSQGIEPVVEALIQRRKDLQLGL